MLDPVLAADWLPVARSDALPGGGVLPARVLGQDLVVWRSGGRALVWRDLCIHRGAKLSLGRTDGAHLVCPYHGWTYNAEGACVRLPAHPDQTPPAKARARVYATQERYGLIWVCLREPANDLPDLPESRDPSLRKVLVGPSIPVRASAPRLVENFLDVAHFAFVHAGTLGDERDTEISDYDVTTGPDGITASDITVFQPDPYGTGEPDRVRYTYRVFRPLLAYLRKETERGGFLSILLAVTPVDEVLSVGWFFMIAQAPASVTDADLTAFQIGIFNQDVAIVESQRPELLPLDLQAELHLRCDRTSIAYRRWLNELGLSFGTA
jgi:phenylpropionate dioxygenase-like ring-hydroxylating dioxygenase large terminal subunit